MMIEGSRDGRKDVDGLLAVERRSLTIPLRALDGGLDKIRWDIVWVCFTKEQGKYLEHVNGMGSHDANGKRERRGDSWYRNGRAPRLAVAEPHNADWRESFRTVFMPLAR